MLQQKKKQKKAKKALDEFHEYALEYVPLAVDGDYAKTVGETRVADIDTQQHCIAEELEKETLPLK